MCRLIHPEQPCGLTNSGTHIPGMLQSTEHTERCPGVEVPIGRCLIECVVVVEMETAVRGTDNKNTRMLTTRPDIAEGAVRPVAVRFEHVSNSVCAIECSDDRRMTCARRAPSPVIARLF